MKKLLLTLTLLTISNLSAQFNVNLERVNALATDQHNKDFYFENIAKQFASNPSSLDYYQISVLYYQPINKIGSLKYNSITTNAYDTFKKLDFNKFIHDYEGYMQEMPANLTLLFLLSFAADEGTKMNNDSDLYSKQLKQVIECLIHNKSLRNKEYLVELNSEIDELILMQVLGIDENAFEKTSTSDGINTIHTYKKGKDEIAFKVLNKSIP